MVGEHCGIKYNQHAICIASRNYGCIGIKILLLVGTGIIFILCFAIAIFS